MLAYWRNQGFGSDFNLGKFNLKNMIFSELTMAVLLFANTFSAFNLSATNAVNASDLPAFLPAVAKAQTLEELVSDYFADTPILAEVARCESQFRHYGKSGNIIRGVVVPEDIGVMQINEKYHGEKAESLGLDIYSLEGNLEYAKYLYEKEGTKPWRSSAKCWNRELAKV